MFFPTSAILLSVGLHAITSAALPAASRGNPLTARDDDQCAPNTNFYRCWSNGFRGCCSVDPCAMVDGCPDFQAPPPAPAPASLTARDDDQCAPNTNFYRCHLNGFHGCCSVDPCAMENGCPDVQAPAAPTCENGKVKVYAPDMASIDRSGATQPGPTSNMHIINNPETTIVQTMSFVLPSEAVGKICYVNWGVPAEREFTVDGNGVTDIQQITPQGLIDVGQADFTNWPQVEGPHPHNAGATDCEENLTFEIELANDGEVFLAQNEETGWYLEYEC